MMTATNIHYELADRVQGLAAGGIGAMLPAGPQDRADPRHRRQRPRPQAASALPRIRPRSEHRLQHPRRRQADRAHRTATQRRGLSRCPGRPAHPRPHHRRRLLPPLQRVRRHRPDGRHQPDPQRVWAEQPPEFFEEAIIDADGTLVATDAECKQGIDIAYDGTWGYHPLLISLANTAEPLYLVNRSGNRPSHEHADIYLDKAVDLCREAGFRRILLRGDTDFTQTKHLDRWDDAGDVRFVFGYAAQTSRTWPKTCRPRRTASWNDRRATRFKTTPRQQPERVKAEIVKRARVQDDPPARGDDRRVRLSPGRLQPGAIG